MNIQNALFSGEMQAGEGVLDCANKRPLPRAGR